jgi:ankyrin repeat protein
MNNISEMNLKCPICWEIMFNSVCASDNNSYHNNCIIKYFNSNNNPKSIITNEPFEHQNIIINKNTNKLIRYLITTTNLLDEHILSLNMLVFELNDYNNINVLDELNEFYNMILHNEKIKTLSKLTENDMLQIRNIQIYKMIIKLMTQKRNLEIIKLLDCDETKKYIDINYTCEYGLTLLIFACCCGLSDVAIKLLEYKNINVNRPANCLQIITDLPYLSPMSVACHHGLIDVVVKLLEFDNIDLDYVDIDNSTPLLTACYYGYPDIAIKLLEHKKININHINSKGNTALQIACVKKKLHIVALKLLDLDNINVNNINNCGNTALINACCLGNIHIIKKILSHPNFDINLINQANDHEMTALLYACCIGASDCVIELLNYPNIWINHQNNNGISAFMIACSLGLNNIINKLLDNSTLDLNLCSYDGNTALIYSSAVCFKNICDVKLELINKKYITITIAHNTENLDVQHVIKKTYGKNIIVSAQFYGSENVVTSILNRDNINIEHKNINGYSALNFANPHILELLNNKIIK